MSTTLSSTRVLRTTLLLSAAATAALAVVGAIVGFAVGGVEGLWSALIAVVLSAIFLGLTAGSILFANRWFGDALYIPIFFGSVMGAWIVKFVLLIVVLFVLRGQPWLNQGVFFVALVISVAVSLVIDVVVMTRMRVPHASDVSLPTLADVEDSQNEPPADDNAPRG